MKSFVFAVALALFTATACAAPYKSNSLNRAASTPTDADILNYALTLEHLEDRFYREGLANFSVSDFESAGFDASIRTRIMEVSADEATHVSFLTAAITKSGTTPVKECTYSFGITNVKSFLTIASVLEGVGVSAYLGAAADILSKNYLTAAGSILTVESRHSAYIRDAVGLSPFPTPFDVPLAFDEVYTLAAPFIVSCPSDNPTLPVKAFPTLKASPKNPNRITAGTILTALTPSYTLKPADGSSPLYAAFITVTGPIFAKATAVDGGFSFTVPEAPGGTAPIAGQSYVVLTSCNQTVTDDNVVAGPVIVEITNTAGIV